MSEQLKFILTEINSTFRTNYDLIKFDALNEVQLLQILMDLLAHYEAGPKIEVKETEPDVMSLQLFEMLRNVKYKPPSGVDPQVFRKDILTGDRATVLSVLQWLLKNKERAVNTAYLARYLTRPNVPPEIMNTTSMKDLSEAYDKLIEEFKEVHKRTKSMPKDNGSEVINDIKEMAVERDIVIKRLEATQLNLFDVSDKEELLQVGKTLRQQQERSVELNEQLTDQQNLTKKTSDQLQRYLNSFHGQMSSLKTPDELILKLTEDLQLNEYLVKEKMPDQLISARRILSVMQAAQNEPITTRQQLLSVQEKVDAVNREIESLMQKKMANIDPQEDKLTPFRQQAAAIRRNKHALADKLQELTTTLHHSEAHLADKQAQVHQLLGDAVLRGEELKKYVTKLRNKSSVYKRQRAALSSLKVEVGVLTRTLDILSIADPTVEMALVNHKKLNIDLDSNEDDNKNTPELEKKSVHDLSQMVAKLTQSLSEVNEELKPLATKLMPIRNEHQTLQQQYEQKKRVYDSTSINLTSQMEPLETQVKELSQTITRKEEEWKHLRQQISKAEGLRETVESESRIQHSELQSPRRPSRMESLLRQLATLETQVASLREDQKSISERQSVVDEQAEMWDNLLKLLQCKIKCKEKSNKKQGYMTITNQTQTFTLQSD